MRRSVTIVCRCISRYVGIAFCTVCLATPWTLRPVAAMPRSGAEGFVPRIEPRMAIIIDDVGNDMKGTRALLTMKQPITVAVMPFMVSSRQDAQFAHSVGAEVILHLPMEPERAPRSWLGPGAITTAMSDAQIRTQVQLDVESVPYVVGLNNHMGSRASSNERVVRDVVWVAKQNHLFIVDSATSYHSKIERIAREMGVPCLRRSLFLDDDHAVPAVVRQVRHLVDDARRDGWSIGIGHVGRYGVNTFNGIRAVLPYAKQHGVTFVVVSDLIHSVMDTRTSG